MHDRFPLHIGLLALFLALSTPTLFGAPAIPGDLTFAALANGHFVKDRMVGIMIDGPVFLHNTAIKGWKAVAEKQTFIDGDSLRTGENGWAVLAWSTDNLLLIKPNSGVRIRITPGKEPRVSVQVFEASLLLSVRDSGDILVEGRQGQFFLRRGEGSFQCRSTFDLAKSLLGTTYYRPTGAKSPREIPEGYFLQVNEKGHESKLMPFDTRTEYEAFRRFRTWLEKFDQASRQLSTDISYKVDAVLLNDTFVSNLETDTNGFRIIDPGSGPVPKFLKFRLKITPYPRPQDRFELYITKDLTFPLKEGREDYWEAMIPTPLFPEFFLKVHYVDPHDRRDRLLEQRFVLVNQRRKTEEVKDFLTSLSNSLQRHDWLFFRDRVDRDYRDWFGNTYFDVVKHLEDNLRFYRDIRLVMRPHKVVFRGNQALVDMTFHLTALTGNWTIRFEDRGTTQMTLSFGEGGWRLRSNSRGIFLQRIKVAVDLRLGILRGRVTDEASGRPVANAHVQILRSRFSTTTDAIGEYLIHNIPPGKYDIEISKNGFGKVTITQMTISPTGERISGS